MLKQELYNQFVLEFSNIIKERNKRKQLNKVTFLCIGTSKVIGDSIGPIVGSNLKKEIEKSNRINILGDLENNIHFNNLENQIYKKEDNELVIAIDSALSKKENIGKIILQNKGLLYGEGLKKNGRSIGDISIKAVIEKNTNNKFINFYKLKNISNENVNIMASIISRGIIQVMNSSINL